MYSGFCLLIGFEQIGYQNPVYPHPCQNSMKLSIGHIRIFITNILHLCTVEYMLTLCPFLPKPLVFPSSHAFVKTLTRSNLSLFRQEKPASAHKARDDKPRPQHT